MIQTKFSPMTMNRITRRRLLGSIGLGAGASIVSGCGGPLHGSEGEADVQWRYVPLDTAAVAAEAYRHFADGGCMYGLFASFIALMAAQHDERYRSFPVYMMKYGAGGVGGWGSVCGALNGGAAIIGLFEQDKDRCNDLIASLFSWYEATELPTHVPKTVEGDSAFPKSVANSILCHASVSNWCANSGNEVGSQVMKERCRRLTADVAAKTAELLNGNLRGPCEFPGLSPAVRSCTSCHEKELKDSLGKMQCGSCHKQLSTKHPAVPSWPTESGDDARK